MDVQSECSGGRGQEGGISRPSLSVVLGRCVQACSRGRVSGHVGSSYQTKQVRRAQRSPSTGHDPRAPTPDTGQSPEPCRPQPGAGGEGRKQVLVPWGDRAQRGDPWLPEPARLTSSSPCGLREPGAPEPQASPSQPPEPKLPQAGRHLVQSHDLPRRPRRGRWLRAAQPGCEAGPSPTLGAPEPTACPAAGRGRAQPAPSLQEEPHERALEAREKVTQALSWAVGTVAVHKPCALGK